MKDLTGMRFGRLVAIKTTGSRNNRRVWECRCDCGNMTQAISTSLLRGGKKSCGCLQEERRIEANTKHGDCGTRLYRIWKGMLARCRNKSSTDYKWYGAKGVTVCDEWSEYLNFKNWAANSGYKDTLTIDRINPYEGYSPDNCRWATIAEQNRNRRKDYENK